MFITQKSLLLYCASHLNTLRAPFFVLYIYSNNRLGKCKEQKTARAKYWGAKHR